LQIKRENKPTISLQLVAIQMFILEATDSPFLLSLTITLSHFLQNYVDINCPKQNF